MIRTALFCAAALGLAACSILPEPAPAAIIYRLAPVGEAVEARADATVVRIDRPGGSTVFNTNDILVTPDGRRMRAAAQARWSQAIPLQLQEALVDALGRSPNVVGVLPSSGTRTDTRVFVTIKNFEAKFDRGEDQAPLAVVRYTATLANASDRTLIDTFAVSKEVRADAINISEIVEAMEQANDAAMMDIVGWLEGNARRGTI